MAVPTLILSTEDDRLIGPEAAGEMVEGIPDAQEVVLEGTGHLLRFTHEHDYAVAVNDFLSSKVETKWTLRRALRSVSGRFLLPDLASRPHDAGIMPYRSDRNSRSLPHHLVGSDLLLVSSYVNWLASEGRIWMSRSIAKMSALQVGSREADAFN